MLDEIINFLTKQGFNFKLKICTVTKYFNYNSAYYYNLNNFAINFSVTKNIFRAINLPNKS